MAKQEARKAKDKLIAQETQLQRIARLRSEKRERAALDREANKNKRKKMKKNLRKITIMIRKMIMYQICLQKCKEE